MRLSQFPRHLCTFCHFFHVESDAHAAAEWEILRSVLEKAVLRAIDELEDLFAFCETNLRKAELAGDEERITSWRAHLLRLEARAHDGAQGFHSYACLGLRA